MPVALVGLSSMLKKKGFRALIINLATEKIFKPKYDVLNLINEISPSFIGLPLYWHVQVRDTLILATKIKKKFPDIKIVAGGFMASYFYKEIMSDFPQIDFIIRGDAELPLVKLLENGSILDLKNIPNLSFRTTTGEIIHNTVSYAAKTEDLDDLDFSDHSTILNPEHAFLTSDEWDFSFDSSKGNIYELKNRLFYSPGRGCAWNCSFCAGCAENQLKSMGRSKPVYKNLFSAAKDISQLVKNGWEKIHLPFDALPNSKYYIALFRILRKEKISFTAQFESFGLPSHLLLREFALTFASTLDNSSITISPETGSETLRRKTRGFLYSNAQLLECARRASELGIRVSFGFLAGLPLESKKDMDETIALVKKLQSISDKFEFFINRIEMEPGALFFERPDEYNVKLPGKSLKNFILFGKHCIYKPKDLSEKTINEHIKRFRKNFCKSW